MRKVFFSLGLAAQTIDPIETQVVIHNSNHRVPCTVHNIDSNDVIEWKYNGSVFWESVEMNSTDAGFPLNYCLNTLL